MARTKGKGSNWNGAITTVGFVIYGALLILFGWQTWQFVNFLFPGDQLLMKVLTFISFDFMALVWAVVHSFYRFGHRAAKQWALVAWVVTFILSLVASILYLVIQSFFRFQVAISPDMVNTGYAISIAALVFNILALMFWMMLEYRVRHPRQDEFDLFEEEDEDEEDEPQPVPQRRAAPPSPPVQGNKNRFARAIDAVHGKDVQPGAQTPTGPQPQSEQTFTYSQVQSMIEIAQKEALKQQAPLDDQPDETPVHKAARQHFRDMQAQQSPLQQPQLDTKQASQAGNGNGKATS